MKSYPKLLCAVCMSCLTMVIVSGCAAGSPSQKVSDKKNDAAKTVSAGKKEWQDTFTVDKNNLVSVGKNKYFILEPGYRLNYKNGQDSLIITVLNETKLVDGVETRIIEERETEKGKLAEVSRNYFAIDKTTSAVYYFGEDVDMYKNGKITNHDGSWLSGVKGAKFGLMMSAEPKVGDKYHQEVAPGTAMDRAEITSVTEKVTVPAGTYENCVNTKDGSAIEAGTGTKLYAPGVGLVRDDDFVLVKVDASK
jgi:hypothetical protein